jgi:pyridoxal biosynthesis lyase PdxS
MQNLPEESCALCHVNRRPYELVLEPAAGPYAVVTSPPVVWHPADRWMMQLGVDGVFVAGHLKSGDPAHRAAPSSKP